MTEREMMVKTMESWVGCKKGDATHKKIVDTYNSMPKPYPRNVKMNYSSAWCACTVTACAITCNIGKDRFPYECSCNTMISIAKTKGWWVEADNYIPKHGDLVMYDWDDSGKGDCVGQADHVGLVTFSDGSTFRVVEGNMGSASTCGTRTMKVNGRYIRGFICPPYVEEENAQKTVEKSDTDTKTTSTTNSSTESAKSFDSALKGNYRTTTALNIRSGAGITKKKLCCLPKGFLVTNYGYYTKVLTTKWFLIQFTYNGKKMTGFCSSDYLKRA